MVYADTLLLFTVLLVGIILVPGMDMLFVLTSTLSGGRRAGAAAIGGIVAGGAINTTIGAAGVSVILSQSATAFAALSLAGALYMAWIGVDLVRSRIVVDRIDDGSAAPVLAVFRRGAVTCLLNPKAHVFVVAVIPQMMHPEFGPLVGQVLVLVAMTAAVQIAIYGTVSLAAAEGRRFLLARPMVTIVIGKAAGALFLAVAGGTLWRLSAML
jgi:threonine/homoserine/homoserine lactone efflux protein